MIATRWRSWRDDSGQKGLMHSEAWGQQLRHILDVLLAAEHTGKATSTLVFQVEMRGVLPIGIGRSKMSVTEHIALFEVPATLQEVCLIVLNFSDG